MAVEKVININNLGNTSSFTKIGLGIGFLILIFIINPCVIVSPGHKGVVLNLGAVSDKVLEEGVHFRMPLLQSVIEIDTRVLKEETKAEAASKDLQNISSVIAVNFHLKPDKVNELYRTIGLNYESVIIDPAIQEVLKGVTAKYTAAELITLREQSVII